MGTWRNRQNALLNFLTTKKFWILAFVVFVLIFDFTANYINHVQNQNVWKSIASLLRNEVNSANTYQISRSLSDMEAENWIKCVRLIETTNEPRIFYETTSNVYCGYFSNITEGKLTAVNGSTWQLSFAIPENIWFLLIRLAIPILVGVALHYAYQLMDRQRKIQEATRLRAILEKDILLDLARQTRHDIASPIGALKIVVQRLEVAPEYSEILQGVVERIEGIFSQLQRADSASELVASAINLESVDLDKIISTIISEKQLEWHLDDDVMSAKLIPVSVVANKIELERIFSNLLNNAIEAKKDNVPLSINIDVTTIKNTCTICIVDNGLGIPSDILANLGQKGYSYGKSKMNSGLGLHHAIRTIESFGGVFKIASDFGTGTSISITLKIS